MGIIQPMDEKASFRPFVLPTILLMLLGWGGLVLLLNFTLPTIWPRWTFFALLVLAFTGTALPFSFILNQRFFTNRAAVVTRQAIWVGIYVAILAWLQIGRILNFSVGLWFVLGFIVIEFSTQLRERPKRRKVSDEPSE